MTTDKMCLLKPGEIESVQFKCGACGASVNVPVAELATGDIGLVIVKACPQCRTEMRKDVERKCLIRPGEIEAFCMYDAPDRMFPVFPTTSRVAVGLLTLENTSNTVGSWVIAVGDFIVIYDGISVPPLRLAAVSSGGRWAARGMTRKTSDHQN